MKKEERDELRTKMETVKQLSGVLLEQPLNHEDGMKIALSIDPMLAEIRAKLWELHDSFDPDFEALNDEAHLLIADTLERIARMLSNVRLEVPNDQRSDS